MTRIFYDLEFLENGRTIELISIGLVNDQGKSYYAVNLEMPWWNITHLPWLMQHVVPHLPTFSNKREQVLLDTQHPDVKAREQIAVEVRKFILGDDPAGAIPAVELNAYYSAYDHVGLMQLWGPMVCAPEGMPWYTRDLKVEADRLDLSTKSEGWPRQNPDLEHHALHDAWHDYAIDKFLREQANGR